MKRFCKWMDAALLLAAPVLLVLLLEGFARGDVIRALSWITQSPRLFLITLGMAMGACLLLAVFRSLRLRCVLTLALGWLLSLIGVASRYKMRYRLEPALFSDLLQLKDAWATASALPFDINYWEPVLICLGFVLLITLCCLIRARGKRRAVLSAMGLALLVLLPRLCTFENAGSTTRYDLANHAHNEGTLYTALAVENQRSALMRVDYSEQEVRAKYRALMENTPTSSAQDAPNIILVLSESFTSHEWLSQYLTPTRTLTPFFDQLAASCTSGWLRVPKAGGGTSETEFEVLTGLRSQYATNPYALGLPPISSLASILREKGLHTSAIHWYTGVYYNRYHNLQSLGFDEFSTTDTTTRDFSTYGMFVSDREHYASALEQLSLTEERDFVFLITMQNHGGYDYADFRQTLDADMPFANALSDRAQQILSNYACLLAESDRALEAFIHQLESYPEPVMLLFFGDHIPPLGDDVYAELGLSTQSEASHLAPFLIWKNTGNRPQALTLNAWELGAYALREAGLLDDPFLTHIETLRQSHQAPDSAYDLLSYDALFGKQYAYAEGHLAPKNEAFQIGGKMALSGFDAVQIGSQIYLRPQLERPDQRFQLSVNGQPTDIPAVSADAGALKLQCIMPRYNALPYNQSNTLSYADAPSLLAQSPPLPTRILPAPEWELHEERGRLSLYRTPIPDAYFAVLAHENEPLDWQPVYGLARSRQYAVSDDNYLYLALSDKDLPLLSSLTLHLLGE